MKLETELSKKESLNLSQYKLFFELSNDLTCVANTEGYFEIISPNFSKLLGYQETDLLNKKFIEFVHPEDVDSTLMEVDKLKKGITTINFINRYRKMDGNYIWLEWSSSPDISTGKIYAMARDVSGRKKNEEIIRQKSEALVKTNNELEQFVYILSHEFQNPVQDISEYTNELKIKFSDTINDEAKAIIQKIIDKKNKMETMTKSLLFLTRISKKIIVTSIDCNMLLKEITTELKDFIVATQTEITSTLLPIIKGDEKEIKILFETLIKYAIKFHRKNINPVIQISTEEKENEFVFIFKNNGIGIDNKYFDSLFLVFNPTSIGAELPESDFGFIISKKIVETHKGKIWVDSKSNEGSIFYFTISKNIVD